MKNIILLILFSVLFIEVRSQVNVGVSATATATAEVIEALSTTETAQLNFGRFSPETEGGKIVIAPDGNRSSQGTVVLAGGTHSAASFNVTGQDGSSFSISLPSATTLTNRDGNKTMLVDEWQSFPPPGVNAGKLVQGAMVVQVGASLIVGGMNDNPKGIYAGTYAVTFAYN